MTSVPRNRPDKVGYLKCGETNLRYIDKPTFSRNELAKKARELYRKLKGCLDSEAREFTVYMLKRWAENYN